MLTNGHLVLMMKIINLGFVRLFASSQPVASLAQCTMWLVRKGPHGQPLGLMQRPVCRWADSELTASWDSPLHFTVFLFPLSLSQVVTAHRVVELWGMSARAITTSNVGSEASDQRQEKGSCDISGQASQPQISLFKLFSNNPKSNFAFPEIQSFLFKMEMCPAGWNDSLRYTIYTHIFGFSLLPREIWEGFCTLKIPSSQESRPMVCF